MKKKKKLYQNNQSKTQKKSKKEDDLNQRKNAKPREYESKEKKAEEARSEDWDCVVKTLLTYIILFKSPRDIEQITDVRKQLNNSFFLKKSYELATKQPFGQLLIDLDPKTSVSLRYCSNIVQPGQPIFIYCPPMLISLL